MRQFVQLLFLMSFSCCVFGQGSSTYKNHDPQTVQGDLNLAQSALGFSYSFNFVQKSYSPLSSAKDLSNGLAWDHAELAIPVGFNLRFFDDVTDSLYLGSFMEKKALGLKGNKASKGPLMVVFGGELMDRAMVEGSNASQIDGLSPIMVKTIGQAGNRITIVEFRNVGFKSDIEDDLVSSDFVNFQLMILEKTSNIEFLMGPSEIKDPSKYFDGKTGPSLGLIPEFNFAKDQIETQGVWFGGFSAIPSVEVADSLINFRDIPANGTGFQFIRQDFSTSNEEEVRNPISVYPNPASDFIKLDLQSSRPATVTLFDIQGRTLKQESLYSSQKMDISNFRAGTYLLKVETEEGENLHQKIMLR
ncbi:MAG: T9SS type A sorting domain-containing protein [Bacteroidia bacterium]|nr:T9SS type A sorting domain-containing protein [Bacteroidia bacterium]